MRELEQEGRELRRANEILKWARVSSGRISIANTGSSRVHRGERGRCRRGSPARSRAHLRAAAGGSEHLLRRPRPGAVGSSGQRRSRDSGDGAVVDGQLLRLRGSQALEGGPQVRDRGRPGSDRSADARRRDRGREMVEASQGHPARSHVISAPGSGEPGVHRDRTEPALGDRSDVRPDVGRGRLRVLHHRCVLPHDCGLAGLVAHAHRDGAGRDRDGPLVPRTAPRRPAVSQRRGVSIHVDSLRRTARGDRRDAVDRDRGRFV